MELRGWYSETQWTPGKSEYHGRTGGAHDGLDLYVPVGTEAYACIDGVIYDDYTSDSYGKTIGVKGNYYGKTYYFFYAHLSERNVKKGDKVKAGKVIGKTGQTGNANNQPSKMAHLHFEVRNTKNKTGGKIDPSLIKEMFTTINFNPEKSSQE